MPNEATKSITIRLPVELHEALVARAKRDHRSLNGQIVFELSKSE
jgi:predicted HicB family RNase H-like nuclease